MKVDETPKYEKGDQKKMDYIYVSEKMNFMSEYICPQSLWKEMVSDRAKMFYLWLLNIGLKEGAYEDDRLYVILPIDIAACIFSTSISSIKRILSELETTEMIKRKRIGGGNPNKIFIKYKPDK